MVGVHCFLRNSFSAPYVETRDDYGACSPYIHPGRDGGHALFPEEQFLRTICRGGTITVRVHHILVQAEMVDIHCFSKNGSSTPYVETRGKYGACLPYTHAGRNGGLALFPEVQFLRTIC